MKIVIALVVASLFAGCQIKESKEGCVTVTHVESVGTLYRHELTGAGDLTVSWISTNLYPVGTEVKLVKVETVEMSTLTAEGVK